MVERITARRLAMARRVEKITVTRCFGKASRLHPARERPISTWGPLSAGSAAPVQAA